jgi:hypothetical protein
VGAGFPRFARNLGLPGAPGEGHLLRTQPHAVHCAATTRSLPVAAAE